MKVGFVEVKTNVPVHQKPNRTLVRAFVRTFLAFTSHCLHLTLVHGSPRDKIGQNNTFRITAMHLLCKT
jgi:hypothetical protein